MKISERDLEVLNFIKNFILSEGFSPSLSEIAAACFMSKPTAQRHVQRLIDMGYLSARPYTARSYHIIKTA